MAESNRIFVVPIVPNRGVITDRNGEVLARNYAGYTLELTPEKIADLDATIAEIGKLVEIKPKDLRRFKKLMSERRSLQTLPVKTRLTDEFRRAALPIPGRGDQGAPVPRIPAFRDHLPSARLHRPHQPAGAG